MGTWKVAELRQKTVTCTNSGDILLKAKFKLKVLVEPLLGKLSTQRPRTQLIIHPPGCMNYKSVAPILCPALHQEYDALNPPNLNSRNPILLGHLRGKEREEATLDTAGFQLFNLPEKYTRFDNGDEEIAKEYYPESIELIEELGADWGQSCHSFNHSTSSPTSFRYTKTKLTHNTDTTPR